MEDGLRLLKTTFSMIVYVLILVVMEDGLRPFAGIYLTAKLFTVLILVVMEDGLRLWHILINILTVS